MVSRLSILLAALVLALGFACPAGGDPRPQAPADAAGRPSKKEGPKMAFNLSSSAFANNEKIPLRYSGDGEDLSPPLAWSGAPEGTAELALIVDDPDAPTAKPFVHWVLYGLSPSVTSLPEGIEPNGDVTEPVKARQGENSWGKNGYGGPAPPRGHGVHHYHFTLYALDKRLNLPSGASKEKLLKALEGSVLAQATLTGLYER